MRKMKTESGKWKVVVIVCVGSAFHFPLIFTHMFPPQTIGIRSTYAENYAVEQKSMALVKDGCKTSFGGRNPCHMVYMSAWHGR